MAIWGMGWMLTQIYVTLWHHCMYWCTCLEERFQLFVPYLVLKMKNTSFFLQNNSAYIKLHQVSDETLNRGPSYLVLCATGSERHHPGGKGVTCIWTLILGQDCAELAKWTWKVEYPTGTSPTDADAIAAATVQTSAVIVYTLYDSSWSQDVRRMGCIVV